MEGSLWAIEALLIAATAIPILKKEAWWIRILDFPRIQIAIAILIVLAADLFLLRTEPGLPGHAFRAALALCILYQVYMMYPYTIVARKTVQNARNPRPDASLRLLISNVRQDNRQAEGLKASIRKMDPDVILTLEPDSWWQSELSEFDKTHPFAIHQAQDNAYGMCFYSRLRVVDSEVLFRVQDDIPSIRARVELPSGTQVELHCLHPRPPVPQEEGRSTERDAELLIVGRESRGKDIPLVIMGDLNDVAWSQTNYLFQRISGLLDPRIGRGLYNTFDARYWFMRFPLDHFFHSNHFRLINLRRMPYFGSDHFPMYIHLSFEPEAVSEQEPAEPAPGDQQQATEKIQKAEGAS